MRVESATAVQKARQRSGLDRYEQVSIQSYNYLTRYISYYNYELRIDPISKQWNNRMRRSSKIKVNGKQTSRLKSVGLLFF
ncbi:AbfB domain-containing protein [Paenibacillus sp. CMAA1364]